MDTGIIRKSNMEEVINGLLQQGEVIAPVRQDGVMVFYRIQSASDVDLEYANTKLSPKGCFFPQTEVLFYYEKEDHHMTMPAEDKRPGFLLGVRPCDARAMALLDPVFDDTQYKDVPYLERRKNRIIIGMACTMPQSTCFCTTTGGNPLDTTGMDIIWQDIGDRYLVKGVTDKGKKALQKIVGIEKATAEDLKEAEEQGKNVLSQLPESAFELDKITERLQSSFEDPFWEGIHERCLGCATCTFVCPTCHCFDIQDENSKGRGRRVRLWDSCMFPLFTLHASGHNPRTSGRERMRQRIMHKFNYFKANNGKVACVGCGRCIRECPVNMDIRQILSVY
jgi:sulfhydrogenase subunit beta (sulfur reductase)